MYYPFSIRLFLTVILGFWLFDGYAQKLPLIQIDITATNAFKGTYLFISICSYEDVTKIVYKVKDSLDNKGLKSDTQYMTLEKYRKEVIDTERNVDPALKLMQKFAEISKKHTHYSMDSVLVSTKSTPLYTKLLNKVANISTDSLENSKANIDRVVLDGTHFDFHIKRLNQQRVVRAHSPTQKSHPILYDLLHQTMELYRNKKNNTFLTKARTDGY